tara:strand:- start:4 stop:228 length:225 start_codon:yes stop_codon:yes gene_type:complete
MVKRRTKNYALMKHMRIIRQFVLAFIAGVGFILLWSGISRWGNINMTHGQSIAVGIGLLLVSGFFAKIFIKNFS